MASAFLQLLAPGDAVTVTVTVVVVVIVSVMACLPQAYYSSLSSYYCRIENPLKFIFEWINLE